MEIKPFEKRLYLASPTMHGEELKYMREAYDTNWMSTIGENINAIEEEIPRLLGCRYGVALSCGTAALHLAVKLAGIRLYGMPEAGHGCLEGRRVFATDMTFAATANPIVYEGGEPIFIDSERESWNMDPEALEKAFGLYPEVKLVIVAHLYGTPARIDRLCEVCGKHGALLIEDAAESVGATFMGRQTGSFGDFNVVSFNGNKIITGSAGGMFLTNVKEDADKVRKWSTQSREKAPWYQHEELGYNYRMSNVIAGVVRGQLPYLEEHIAQKKAIFERYREGFKGLPVKMAPHPESVCEPNYWLSCMTIEPEAMCEQRRTDMTATFVPEPGKTCPTEILAAIAALNAEGRPIWKPMHMQPIYSKNGFVTLGERAVDEDIFERGLCLPSDNKMTAEQQDRIIAAVRNCFSGE